MWKWIAGGFAIGVALAVASDWDNLKDSFMFGYRNGIDAVRERYSNG